MTLLGEAYNLATQAEKQKRTHSKVAKVRRLDLFVTSGLLQQLLRSTLKTPLRCDAC